MSWEKTTLGEISINIQTGPFGSQLHQSDYSIEGIPVVMPKDMLDGRILEDSIARVDENHAERLKRHKINVGNILYSRRGDVGKCAYVTEKENGWLCGTGCLRVETNADKADSKFIFYLLQLPKTIGWVENHAVGSTMLNLNTSILSAIPIALPDIKTQRKIADILSKYDDLIENNQKQIKLLEEAAQRLYKEWFVDLCFPGYENATITDGVPEGWNKSPIGDLIDKSYRSKQVKTADYMIEGDIPVVDQSRAFVAGYTNDIETVVDLGKPVIVFGDHTRILKYIQFPFAKGADGTQLIVSNCEKMPQVLLYFSLLNVDLSYYHYARHFKYLKAEEIIVPDKTTAEKYDAFATTIMKKVHILRKQIQNAEQARDRLLPKLMSGEIEV